MSFYKKNLVKNFETPSDQAINVPISTPVKELVPKEFYNLIEPEIFKQVSKLIDNDSLYGKLIAKPEAEYKIKDSLANTILQDTDYESLPATFATKINDLEDKITSLPKEKTVSKLINMLNQYLEQEIKPKLIGNKVDKIYPEVLKKYELNITKTKGKVNAQELINVYLRCELHAKST